jgi:Fe2+ transport system protein B
MTDPFYIAIGILLSGVIASRFISENALKLLTADKKAELVDAFSTQRKFGLLIIVVLLFATFQWPLAMAVALVGYFVAFQLWTLARLRKMAFPASYIRRFLVASFVSFAGFAAFVLYLFWSR